jgi:hypothetical protein
MAPPESDSLLALPQVDLGEFVFVHQFHESAYPADIKHVLAFGSSVVHAACPFVTFLVPAF